MLLNECVDRRTNACITASLPNHLHILQAEERKGYSLVNAEYFFKSNGAQPTVYVHKEF
jgi:hypothetical protein